MTNKICPACNSKSLGTDSFCMKCGCDLRNVQVDFERPTIPFDKECPECKTGNLKFATICRKCGYSFSAIKEQSEQNNNEESIGYSAEKQITDSENEVPNRDNNSETWDLILYGSQIIIAFMMFIFIDNNSMKDNSSINKTDFSSPSTPQPQIIEGQTNTSNSELQNNNMADTTVCIPDTLMISNDTVYRLIESPNGEAVTERETYYNYLKLIKERKFSELKAYFSDVLELYMSKTNITSDEVINEAIKYSNRWDMIDFQIVSFERNPNNDFTYHSIVKMQFQKDLKKIVSFEIIGIIGFDADGKINKLKDIDTKKLTN